MNLSRMLWPWVKEAIVVLGVFGVLFIFTAALVVAPYLTIPIVLALAAAYWFVKNQHP